MKPPFFTAKRDIQSSEVWQIRARQYMFLRSERVTEGTHDRVEVAVGFRVMGHDLEPEEVSRLLGLEPTESHKRGDARIGRSGRHYSDYSEGLWAWRPGVSETAPLSEHLLALLGVLEPKAATLKRLRKLGQRMDVFIGLFGPDSNFEFALSADLLERMGRLGIDLEFDVYCCQGLSYSESKELRRTSDPTQP